MGNGVSGDQGSLPSRGKRDVGATFDRKQHDWSEQARAQEVDTLSPTSNSYIGAQPRGMKPEEDDARLGAYSSAPNRNQKSSVMKDDTQSVMYEDTRLRNRKKKDRRKQD